MNADSVLLVYDTLSSSSYQSFGRACCLHLSRVYAVPLCELDRSLNCGNKLLQNVINYFPLVQQHILRLHQYCFAYLKSCNFDCTVLTQQRVSLREITKSLVLSYRSKVNNVAVKSYKKKTIFKWIIILGAQTCSNQTIWMTLCSENCK